MLRATCSVSATSSADLGYFEYMMIPGEAAAGRHAQLDGRHYAVQFCAPGNLVLVFSSFLPILHRRIGAVPFSATVESASARRHAVTRRQIAELSSCFSPRTALIGSGCRMAIVERMPSCGSMGAHNDADDAVDMDRQVFTRLATHRHRYAQVRLL